MASVPIAPNRPDSGMPPVAPGGGILGDVPMPMRDASITPSGTVLLTLPSVPQVPNADTVLLDNVVPRAKLCYERTLLTIDPSQAGDLGIVMTLASTGAVASVSAEPANPRGLKPITVSCVLAAARSVSFSVSGDATGVTLRPKLSFRRQ